MVKYTREILQDAVSKSTSFVGVLRQLGFKAYSGSMSVHIKKRVEHYNIDTSHFLGLHSNLGKSPTNRKAPEVILRDGYTHRVKADQLRRALLAVGVPHVCTGCGVGTEWRGRSLVLEIDHVNGDWTNNRRGNLRFLCPNCHSQTMTFGVRNLPAS